MCRCSIPIKNLPHRIKVTHQKIKREREGDRGVGGGKEKKEFERWSKSKKEINKKIEDSYVKRKKR